MLDLTTLSLGNRKLGNGKLSNKTLRNKLIHIFSVVIISSIIVSTYTFASSEIIIYSGRSDKFIKPAVKAFEEKTGVKVIIHAGKSTALLNKLKIEGSRTDADIFISNDAGTLQKGTEFSLFESLPASIGATIPANYRGQNNTWLGISARARVLVINTQKLTDNIPTSVFDLADQRFKDKLAITNSSNESYVAGTTVYMRLAGKQKTQDWLAGMKKNVGNIVFNKHSKIVKAVAQGKKTVGLVNHYYIYRHLAKHPNAPIKIILPDQAKNDVGIAWNVAGVALSKHSKHKDNALKFIAFLASKEGQKLFAEANHEYPTRTDVTPDPLIPPLKDMRIADIKMVELGQYRNTTIDLIESVGMP